MLFSAFEGGSTRTFRNGIPTSHVFRQRQFETASMPPKRACRSGCRSSLRQGPWQAPRRGHSVHPEDAYVWALRSGCESHALRARRTKAAVFDEVYKNQPVPNTVRIQESASSRASPAQGHEFHEALRSVERALVPEGRLSYKWSLPVLKVAREYLARFTELLVEADE